MPKSRGRKPKQGNSNLDRRAVEEAESLQEALAAFAEKAENDPKGLAADFVDMARDEPDAEVARNLALDALKLDPLCGDALIILSDLLPGDDPARLDLLETALGMTVQAMGDRAFERFAGRFGTAPETLSYLSVRYSLAEAHYLAGNAVEALRHWYGILDLWPRENFGVRDIAAVVLFEIDDLDGLEGLLRRFPDEPSARWAYHWALLSFRRDQRCIAAQGHLSRALQRNRFVSDYLLGRRTMPNSTPFEQQPESTGEAQRYVAHFQDAWLETPGALDWLRDSVKAAGGN